jgi:AcrR family transcriptional regulator
VGAADVTPSSRRPRDRSEQIAARASDLFAERGYQSVKMGDIAEAAGITPRAIYRHFESKQALLAQVVQEQQGPVIALVERLSAAATETSPLDKLTAVADVHLDSRRLSVLWQREARHLKDEDFALVRSRTVWLARQYAALIVLPYRPDLEDDEAGALLRAWVMGSVVSSSSYFDVTISRAKLVQELVDATRRAIEAHTAPAKDTPARPAGPRRMPGSRREQLLIASAHAFRRHGYAGVSIDDIGREVGLVGPGLYRHFDTKADILAACATRFSEWRALETLRALERESRDDHVIHQLIENYVSLATAFPELVALSLTERLFLPPEVRERLQRAESETLAEWQRWLLESLPELEGPQAAVRVNVARAVIDDLVRTRQLRTSPNFETNLRAMALATLGLEPAVSADPT